MQCAECGSELVERNGVLVCGFTGCGRYGQAQNTGYGQPLPHVYRTKTGRELTDNDIQALADEAERGYDVDQLAPVPTPLPGTVKHMLMNIEAVWASRDISTAPEYGELLTAAKADIATLLRYAKENVPVHQALEDAQLRARVAEETLAALQRLQEAEGAAAAAAAQGRHEPALAVQLHERRTTYTEWAARLAALPPLVPVPQLHQRAELAPPTPSAEAAGAEIIAQAQPPDVAAVADAPHHAKRRWVVEFNDRIVVEEAVLRLDAERQARAANPLAGVPLAVRHETLEDQARMRTGGAPVSVDEEEPGPEADYGTQPPEVP